MNTTAIAAQNVWPLVKIRSSIGLIVRTILGIFLVVIAIKALFAIRSIRGASVNMIVLNQSLNQYQSLYQPNLVLIKINFLKLLFDKSNYNLCYL